MKSKIFLTGLSILLIVTSMLLHQVVLANDVKFDRKNVTVSFILAGDYQGEEPRVNGVWTSADDLFGNEVEYQLHWNGKNQLDLTVLQMEPEETEILFVLEGYCNYHSAHINAKGLWPDNNVLLLAAGNCAKKIEVIPANKWPKGKTEVYSSPFHQYPFGDKVFNEAAVRSVLLQFGIEKWCDYTCPKEVDTCASARILLKSFKQGGKVDRQEVDPADKDLKKKRFKRFKLTKKAGETGATPLEGSIYCECINLQLGT